MAASNELLANVLLPQESEQLTVSIREKIEAHLNQLNNKLDDTRMQYERLRVNSEQQTFELEKQISDCESRLESEANKVIEFQTKMNEYELQCTQLTSELHQIQDSHNNVLNEQMHNNRIIEQLELDKRESAEILEKRSREMDKYTEEIAELRAKLEASIKERCDAITKSEEISSKELTLEYREQRLNQERELLSKQIDWLNKELTDRTQEVNSVRREKNSQTIQLQNQLDQVTEELSTLREVNSTIKASLEKQIQESEAMAQKLKDARDASVSLEEGYQQQLRAQTRLADLYKSSAEDGQTRIEELVTAVEELQNVLSQTQEDFQKHEAELLEKEANIIKERDTLQDKIEAMDKELSNANKLLSCLRPKGLSPENIAALSPSAAIASNLLKSGMTLTQIYCEYTKLSEELRIEKHENERLNQYIDQILQEIEERAPQLKRQKEDYEKAVETNASLSRQLENALKEFGCMRVETDEAKRKSGHFERENQRLMRQVGDLGLQVRTLLKEIEELRCGIVGTDMVDDEDVTSSADVITKRLVTFKSIEELQTQNEQLLMVVRDLSETQEANERENTNEKTAELEKALSTAMEELEELRVARAKQAEVLESIVRQKEMYRVLLDQNQTSPTSSTRMSPGGLQPGSLSPNVKIKEAMAQLQEEFKQYKQEKSEYDKELTEQAEKAKEEASEMRLQTARLTAQLEHSNERYKILQSNIEGCKKENSALIDKSQRLSAQVLRHEQIADVLRQDLMSVQEKCSRAEVINDNLKAERDLLKSMEVRWLQEKEVLLREQKGQSILMANLQAIQNNLERGDSEAKLRLTSRIELMEKENNNLRRKLEIENEQYKVAVKRWEKEVNQVRERVDAETEKHHKVRDELTEAYSKMNALKQELSETQTKLATAENRLSQLDGKAGTSGARVVGGSIESELKDLNFDLLNVKSENKALKDQLNQAKQHLEQYKTIANSVEQEMKNELEASKLFKETMEKRLHENLELHSELEKKIQDLENEKQTLLNENQTLLNENLSQSSDLRKDLATAQLELQNALQKAEVAAQTEQHARQDCQQQLRLAQEAQDRYEHELILHAADVEALSAVKLQLENAMSKLPVAEEIARKANHALETQTVSWEEQKQLIYAGKKELEERCAQLEKQNAHLHDQIELMSTQMLALQSRTTPETLHISLSEDASKSAEQLLEVIRFLRRDKEIANTKLESVNAENSRFSSKIEFLEKQLEELQKNAIDNMQNSAVSLQTATQHAEFLRKVEMVNVLSDSNRLLREERDTAVHNNKELEAKLSAVEKEVAPLQEKNRDLVVHRDTLTSEVQVLKNEVKRWEARTKQLVEHRTNPEELKRANVEKENYQKQVTQLTEDIQRQRAEISRMNLTMTSLQNDLATAKANMQKKEKEFEKVSEEIAAKDAQMIELNKTIQQVKKIGRKYKTQYDELKVQYDEIKANETDSNKEQTDSDAVRQELETKLQEAEEKAKLLIEQNQKINDELAASKKGEDNIKTQAAGKEERSRKVLLTARQKMHELTTQRDMMSKEIEELKKQKITAEQNADEGNLRLSTLRSQYEGRISRLERELKEAIEEREKTQKGCEELMSKMSQHQKQFGQYQASKVTPTASTGSTSSEPPPTANIKPLAPSATNTAQRPHAVSTSAPPSRTTPTASIRPMAIPLTRKVVVAPSAAPTSAADVHEESLSATQSPPSLPQATVAPTPVTIQAAATVTPTTSSEQNTVAVAPVMASDESLSEAETVILGMPSSSTSPTPTPSTSDTMADGSTATPVVTASTGISTSVITVATTVTSVLVQSAGEQSGECRESCETETTGDASTSELTPSSSSTSKRQRVESGEHDKDASIEWSPQAKKVRTVMSPEVRKQSEEESTEMASSSGAIVEASYEAVTSTSTEIATEKSPADESVAEQVIDEIILVESDEDGDPFLQIDPGEDLERDDDEENEDEDEDDEEEEDEDEMEGEYSQEGQLESEEQMQDDKIDDERLEDDDMEEAASDEDVVEIIEDDDEDEQMEAQDEVPVAQPQISTESLVDSGRPPALRNIPVRMDRLPSTGRQQLTSFGQSGQFDDGDDSIVPSTPTLFPPRRSDGFAEAVNSPHVPQGRFVFGGASQEMVVPVSTQLGSQGGMDDTRMDLQLDESSGRSVPTTPLQVSPPAESEVPTQATSPSSVVPEAPSDVTHVKGSALPIQEIPVESASSGAGDSIVEPVVEEPEVQQPNEENRPTAEEVSNIPSLLSETISEPNLSEISTESRATTSQVQTTTSSQRRPTPIVWEDPINQPRPPSQTGRLPPGRRMRVPGAQRGMPGMRGMVFRGSRQMSGRVMRRPMRRGGRQPF